MSLASLSLTLTKAGYSAPPASSRLFASPRAATVAGIDVGSNVPSTVAKCCGQTGERVHANRACAGEGEVGVCVGGVSKMAQQQA